MPTVLLIAILAVSSLVTSFISGILGMAGGMILMGILLAVVPLPQAMMLHGITQLASNGWRAVLAGLGYTDGEVEELVRAGAVHCA